jgi:hypothetical protein
MLEALRRLDPVTVTVAPPFPDPKLGLRPVTTGAGTKTYEYSSPTFMAELFPPAVTVTSTVPSDPAGGEAVIEVALLTLKESAGVFPKSTAEAPVKLDPVTVTEFPPARGPELGETELTDGMAVLNAAWTATQLFEDEVFHTGDSVP